MPELIQSALIGAGSTLLAAAVGVVAIVIQLGRQGSLNRQSIAEAEKRRLRSAMYEEVEVATSRLVETQANFIGKLLLAMQEIKMASILHAKGERYQVPTSRIIHLNELKSDLMGEVSAVISLIERRQFVAPEILVFRSAIESAVHGFKVKFEESFFKAGMIALPVDLPNGEGTYPYGPLSLNLAEELETLVFAMIGDLHGVAAYVGDFAIEMQNLLVADLFGSEVAHRTPIDPKYRPVTLANAGAMERYFADETPWGAWIKEQEAVAKERFEAAQENQTTHKP